MVLEEEDLEEGNIQQLKTNMELKAISRSNTSVRGTTRVGFANKTHQRQQLARQDVQEVVHVDVSRHIADRAVGQSKQREAGGLDRPRRTCGEQSAEEQLQCIADRSANGGARRVLVNVGTEDGAWRSQERSYAASFNGHSSKGTLKKECRDFCHTSVPKGNDESLSLR